MLNLEVLEDRTVPAAIPVATLIGVPPNPMIGESFSFTAQFDNASPTDVGFGPYLDLYLKTTGTDGTGAAIDDGMNFISATFLGVPLNTTVITLTAGGVAHPFAVDTAGNPLIILPPAGFAAGDTLVVLAAPFGSFTATRPPADVLINVSTSNLADLNSPLPIRVQPGFIYGNDALANPATDPTIVGAAVTTTVSPTVLRLTKTYVGPEDETATGPNFPRQYQVIVDVANGQTITNLDLTDVLPNNLQFVQVDSTTVNGVATGTTAVSTPSTTTPGGTLTRRFASVLGTTGANDAVLTFTYYVPLNSSVPAPVINAVSGDDATSIDDASTQGNWTPIDGRDTPVVASSNVTANDHTLTDKSIAIQKSVAIVTDTGAVGESPGDTLEYTLNFQVSDYFAFQNIVVTDLFSDGQTLVPGSVALSVTDGHIAGGPTSGAVDGANFTLTPNFTGGSDQLIVNVSNELITRAFSPNGRLVGGAIPAGGTGGPPPTSAPPLPFGATTGTITFRTVIQDQFQIDFPSGDASVDQGDRLTNGVTIQGDLLSVANLTTPTGQSEADTSAAAVTIESGNVSKSIYAINGNTAFGSVQVKPGDTVTYRLQFTLPTSDIEAFSLSDYLPLPVFLAAQVTSPFNDVTSATPPAAGQAQFGPADTFRAYSGVVPTIVTDAVANSVQFVYGFYDNPANTPTNIDVLFTVTVSGDPFADGLFLTNQVRASEGSTNQGTSTSDQIIQIQLTEPVLNIRKGVIATNSGTGVFAPTTIGPAGVTFAAPGSVTPFTGTISSNGLAANLINSNLSNVDAGDLVTFAIVVENTGSSANGAFDVRIRDTLPAGFVIPGTGLNLQARDGTGAVIGFINLGTGLFDPLGGIELNDPGPTNPSLGGIDQFNATNGRNIAVITYDLQVAGTATPAQTLTNTATLTNFAGQEGGPDHTTTDLTDPANVQIQNVAPTKSIASTSETFTPETGTGSNANPRLVAIGEVIRYRLVVDVSETTTPNFQLRDQLPAGLTFLDDNTATVAFVSDQTAFTSTNPAGATLGLALGNGPLGTNPFVTGNETTIASITPTFLLSDANIGSSNSLTADPDVYATNDDVYFKLGDLVNNDRDANREYIVIEFNALMDNTVAGSNDAGENRDNNFQVIVGGSVLATSANVRARIVEPALTISKVVTPLTGDAGDTVSFTVTYSNPAGANNASAFDTRLLDTLPASLVLNVGSVTITPSGGATGVTNASTGNTVDVTVATIPLGGSVIVEYSATLVAGVTPGQTITNTATVTATSLPGTNGSGAPGTPGSGTGERTGNGTAPNDLTWNDPATVTVNAIAPQKSLVTTSESSTTGTNDATIGEIVRYRMVVLVPESSTLANFRFVDALPVGLTFINDGTATVALVSNNLGMTSSTLTGAGLNATGNQATVSGIVPTFALPGAAITGGPFVSGTDVTFGLGDLSNDDRDADQEFVVVEFNALVDNAGTTAANSNDSGEILNNTYTIIVNGNTSAPSNTVPVTVVEPQITNVNKVVNVASGDAGDSVTYTVTFSNTGTATAFDAILTDTLPASVTRTGAVTVSTTGTVTGIDSTGTTGNSLQVLFASIAPGATVTVTYTATLNSTVAPGDVISNTASLVYTSLPGPLGTTSNPTGSSVTTISGSTTGERNNAGGINDYSDNDGATVTVPNATLVKSLVTTSEASTLGNNVTIGEVATYQLVVTLPEGTTPTLRLIDNIPAGNSFVAGSVVVDTTGFNGTVPVPTVTAPGGTGVDLQLDFGSISVANDNVVGNNSFIVRYQVVTLNIPGNNGVTPPAQTTLPNTASVVAGTAPPVSSNTITTTVVEPRVTIVKNIVETLADAAQTVTMTFTVQNTGTSNAFDVIVRDVFSTANFDVSTVNFGTVVVNYPAGFTPTIDLGTGEILYSGGTIAAGATATFSLTVALSTTVTPTQVINNTAQVPQATTLPGIDPNERNVPVTPSSDNLTINSNAISGFVYVDADNNGIFDVGETPLQNVTITLTGTDHLNNPVTRTIQTLADGSYSFTLLRPGSYVLTEPTQPTGLLDGLDTPGTLFNGTALAPTGDEISAISIPLGSNATGVNYNFGELQPASVSNFVWEDTNGNGQQDIGELGIDGILVTLTGTDDLLNPVTQSTTTAGGGLYAFNDLRPGSYQLTFGTLPGFVFTVQDSAVATDITDSDANPTTGQTAAFTLIPGQNDTTRDAGLYQPLSVGDRVWYDINGNASQDLDEPGIPGATVSVIWAGPDGNFGNGDDVVLPPVTTGADGIWTVPNAPPGNLQATVTNLPNGLTVPTFDLNGIGTANVATFVGVSGVNRTDVDFGYRGTASLGDRVWNDQNGNGAQDPGEPGIPGVGVNLTWLGFDGLPGGDDVLYTTTTDNLGIYGFANLPSGNFVVSLDPATLPANLTETFDLDGVGTANTTETTLTPGQARTEVDFGYQGSASVGDTVW
ncbi:MAG: isopeptide-forming domain-containing fimbrial protein [Planctomycetes bacterium]|nr:isopeptide-forming domain-containing fimbrial protein [Planctomycetota bacterium]